MLWPRAGYRLPASEPRTAPLHRPPVRDRWGDWCLSMVEGEASYSCANHCETSLRTGRYHWPGCPTLRGSQGCASEGHLVQWGHARRRAASTAKLMHIYAAASAVNP